MIATDPLRMVVVACMLLVRWRGSMWVICALLFLPAGMWALALRLWSSDSMRNRKGTT